MAAGGHLACTKMVTTLHVIIIIIIILRFVKRHTQSYRGATPSMLTAGSKRPKFVLIAIFSR